MIKKVTLLVCTILGIFLFEITDSYAQVIPNSFRYQAILRDASGIIIPNQAISLKIGIYSGSPSGSLEWEEIHNLSTDPNGLYLCFIGAGTSTGNGSLSSFSTIPWQSAPYFVKISIDVNGGSTYSASGTVQLYSVPYSFYSSKTGSVSNLHLYELTDADSIGISSNKILKWNGLKWTSQPDNDSDTVSYAGTSGHAKQADTALHAVQLVTPTDTVKYAYNTDSSVFSNNTLTVNNSTNSINSDTATYARNYLPYNWSITGNSISPGKFIGTITDSNLVLKTNAIERMRLTTTGQLAIGTTLPAASSHFTGNDGFISQGTFGTGSAPDASLNTRFMWYPKKASLRLGQITSNRWDDAKIGNYTLASGYNTQASGLYSIAMGINSVALNENCISIGYNCSTNITTGAISNGGSIAMGDSCIVDITRSVSMGYKVINRGGLGYGYLTKVSGGGSSSAWGAFTNGSGLHSIVLGYYASNNSKQACFVFADASSPTVTANTANHQFMVRASGGTVFYSDTVLSNGVELFAGGGAWASVSDKRKKENFQNEDPEELLKKITALKITSWNYKSQNRKIRHIGPMAQDFYSAFLIGESSTSICTIDIDGVTLIGIKALEKRTKNLTTRFDDLDKLKSEIITINNFNSEENRIKAIEQVLKIN